MEAEQATTRSFEVVVQHREVAFSVGDPGARDDIDRAERYLNKDQRPVFVQEEDGHCLGAAIVNALDIVRGRDVVTSMREYFEKNFLIFCDFERPSGFCTISVLALRGVNCQRRTA